jgi:hypothetical protein
MPSLLPGIDVIGARDSSWDFHHLILLRMAAKPSHMGADVDGLDCHLHQPTNYA